MCLKLSNEHVSFVEIIRPPHRCGMSRCWSWVLRRWTHSKRPLYVLSHNTMSQVLRGAWMLISHFRSFVGISDRPGDHRLHVTALAQDLHIQPLTPQDGLKPATQPAAAEVGLQRIWAWVCGCGRYPQLYVKEMWGAAWGKWSHIA